MYMLLVEFVFHNGFSNNVGFHQWQSTFQSDLLENFINYLKFVFSTDFYFDSRTDSFRFLVCMLSLSSQFPKLEFSVIFFSPFFFYFS